MTTAYRFPSHVRPLIGAIGGLLETANNDPDSAWHCGVFGKAMDTVQAIVVALHGEKVAKRTIEHLNGILGGGPSFGADIEEAVGLALSEE